MSNLIKPKSPEQAAVIYAVAAAWAHGMKDDVLSAAMFQFVCEWSCLPDDQVTAELLALSEREFNNVGLSWRH